MRPPAGACARHGGNPTEISRRLKLLFLHLLPCRRVLAAFRAAIERSWGLRRRAACRACRDRERCDAAERLSRFSARVVARDRFLDGARRRRPWLLAVSCLAFFRVAADVFPLLGEESLTPARRASERPIAMACFADRAP